jgi:hypothetical protein
VAKKKDVYEQLMNVIEGFTADGDPHGPPIAIPGGNRAVGEIGLMLNALYRDLELHIPGDMALDRVRTAVILVFLRWLALTRITTHLRLNQMVRRVALRTVP